MAPDLPPGAVEAAEMALYGMHDKRGWSRPAPWWAREAAEAMTAAAAPAIRAAERERIRQLAIDHRAWTTARDHLSYTPPDLVRPFADLIGDEDG
jgi:hypothetical protein